MYHYVFQCEFNIVFFPAKTSRTFAIEFPIHFLVDKNMQLDLYNKISLLKMERKFEKLQKNNIKKSV